MNLFTPAFAAKHKLRGGLVSREFMHPPVGHPWTGVLVDACSESVGQERITMMLYTDYTWADFYL